LLLHCCSFCDTRCILRAHEHPNYGFLGDLLLPCSVHGAKLRIPWGRGSARNAEHDSPGSVRIAEPRCLAGSASVGRVAGRLPILTRTEFRPPVGILTWKAALEGERKKITVLFADTKASMELLADRDPEEARKLLDPVLEHMMESVHRYEGTVNQLAGDGIMAAAARRSLPLRPWHALPASG
jgi:hypothetical protein